MIGKTSLSLWTFSLTFFLISNVWADARIARLDVEQPRGFGYLIGDKFQRVIHLELHSPYVLDETSLPEASRLNQWLAVEAPRVETRHKPSITQYTIYVTYQVINIKSATESIPVNSHTILYHSVLEKDRERYNALVPASRVNLSAIISKSEKHLQADHEPKGITYSLKALWFFGSVFLLAIALVIYLFWSAKFNAKKHPFANANVRLKKLQKANLDDAHSQALEIVHNAFNETAGKTVFLDQLNGFINEQPQFASSFESIENFFNYSRKYFFEPDRVDQATVLNMKDLIDLTQTCHDIESGLA